ncbi:MAG: hypothetical protein IK079_01320 [Desulfovibrio sp.]|nr:hypothetical protein [Desulfovibrio sp.]
MHIRFLFSLAFKDWLYERTTTLCAIIALASMVTPILILQGVRNGVIDGMRAKLLQDPTVLVITPISSQNKASYTKQDIAHFQSLPAVRFAVGRIREIAMDVSMHKKDGPTFPIHLEPCAEGEPLFLHHNLPIPKDGATPEIALSQQALTKLQAQPGDILFAKLGRKNHAGRLETHTLQLRIVTAIPAAIANRTMGFVTDTLLEDIQDYRDDFAVPQRGMTGQKRLSEHTFASFRIYAKDLDSVAIVAHALAQEGIETRCSVREIAAIKSLESALNQVIALLSLAVGAGFVAFTLSSTQGILVKKERQLGLLHLFGCQKIALTTYPLVQSTLTAVSGCMLGILAASCVGVLIDIAFANESQGMVLCKLTMVNFLYTTSLVLSLSLLASLKAAKHASTIDPAQVLREL